MEGRVDSDRALWSITTVAGLVKGPSDTFGPLKTVLGSISAVYPHYQVCCYALFKVLL